MIARARTAFTAPFAALCVGLLACALWLPLHGEVVYASRDLHGFVIPELELHLHGNHGSGPALWDPHVQLGRPATHTGGLSQGYWLCRVFSWVLDDAWELHSALVLATLVLGGLFAWAFFRVLDLHPWAAAACALGFAFASFHGHTGLHLCYPSGSVWAMGLCWALARNLRATSFGNGLLLAFVVHSSTLAAYPQNLVWSAYLGLCLMLALLPPRGQRLRRLGAIAVWSLVGLVSAAPFLFDLWEQARGSSRWFDEELLRDPQLPRIYALEEARAWLAALRELGDPLWNGRQHYNRDPHFFWGTSFTPFFGAAALLAVLAVRTKLVRLAAGLVLAELLFSVSATLYRFGIHYLGLWLSDFLPFAAATPLIFLLAAVGFDHCLRFPGRWSRCSLAFVLPVLAAAGALAADPPLDPWNVGLSLALAGGAACALVWPSWPLLAVAALVSAGHYGVAALPTATRAHIEKRLVWQGRLAEEVKRRTAGARFAWVGDDKPQQLLPNTEQYYGLYSIHSFEPLSSLRYQSWTQRISQRGAQSRGRFFEHVVGLAGLESEDFARSGVRLVLSYQELHTSALRPSGKFGLVHLYEVVALGPSQAWVPRSAYELTPGEARISAPIATVGQPSERRPDGDDHMVLTLGKKDEAGLLWLNQQYHPRWRARAGDERLETALVDGFWQGVLVPAGASEVTLDFRPGMRWSWAPQLLFSLAALGWFLRRLTSGAKDETTGSVRPQRGTGAVTKIEWPVTP